MGWYPMAHCIYNPEKGYISIGYIKTVLLIHSMVPLMLQDKHRIRAGSGLASKYPHLLNREAARMNLERSEQ